MSRLKRTFIAYGLPACLFVAIALILCFNIWSYVDLDKQNPSRLKQVQVNLGYATYVGSALPNGISQFLGMRYATPPTGDLRWRAPREPLADQGVVQANQFGPICFAIGVNYPDGGQSEDCLFVNIWTPSNATHASNLPVWVFIQGGGYNSNSNANWNGSKVVEVSGHNIVMVNFNYRVGMWGFLASERIRKDGDLNAGLLDQRLLLKWVKSHISMFGGNPNHVVIHGLSAGAGSVATHLTAYGGRDDGLFVGAMSESLFFPSHPQVPELEYQFDRVLDKTGCRGAKDQVACLRGKSTGDIQPANFASPHPGRSGWPLFYWTPCVDGDLIQDFQYQLYKKGSFIKVPILFGATTDDGSVFAANAATPDQFVAFLKDNYPSLTDKETKLVLDNYPLVAPLPNHEIWYPSASMAYGELTFICPTNTILNTFAAASLGNASWSYRFNVQDDGNTNSGIGVPHVFEAPAIFGPESCPSPESYRTYNAPIVPVMMNYWISFIRDLNPNTHKLASAPVWGAWGSDQSRLVVETGNSRMERVDKGQTKRCDFWKSIGTATKQKT